MNLSLSVLNLPFFVPSYCVFPPDGMMRHLLAYPPSFFSFFLLRLYCHWDAQWLQMWQTRCLSTTNIRQAVRALFTWLYSDTEGGHPLGNHPWDRKTVGGWLKTWWSKKTGTVGGVERYKVRQIYWSKKHWKYNFKVVAGMRMKIYHLYSVLLKILTRWLLPCCVQ